MFGGGTFTVQNKVLNGTYINFVSATKASAALTDRGVATMPLELDWGVDGSIFEVTAEDFQKNSLKIFGYPYTHEKMKGLRDLFMNIKTLYAYRLSGDGYSSASVGVCTAKCRGVRGNDLSYHVEPSVDTSVTDGIYTVRVYLENTLVFEQNGVKNTTDLEENDFVIWNKEATLSLGQFKLTGGTNGSTLGESHQSYLDKIESYSFNTMGVVKVDAPTKHLYTAFVKRMREQVGAKFQCVLHNHPANYEGVINVKNNTTPELVYWVTGATAGCAVNKSLLNRKYDGEFTIDTDYTQLQLEGTMKNGEFTFHNVNGEVRVLADINSFVSGTEEKSVEIFGENQCVRVMDQIANDIAVLFNTKYLGKVPNDAAGRISLWNDIVKHHNQLQDIRAIQEFNADDVTVNQGDAKNSVVVGDAVTIIVGMAKLYMTVTVQ